MSTKEPRSFRDATLSRSLQLVAVGLASLFALAAMIAVAVKMLRSGRGLETHHSFWLVEVTWTGLLVFVIACVVAVVAGLVWRFYHDRREAWAWKVHEDKWGHHQEGNKPT